MSKAGEVLAIKRAGLTNDPAIDMKALCSVEEDAPQDDSQSGDGAGIVAMLREALGAAPDTPVADLIRQAREIIAAADMTRTDNRAAKEMAASYMKLLAEIHHDKVEAALERARASGKLVPAMEGWAVELASSNLPAFEAWEACALPLVNLTGQRQLAGREPPPELLERYRFKGRSEKGSEQRLAVCSQLGIDPAQTGDKG